MLAGPPYNVSYFASLLAACVTAADVLAAGQAVHDVPADAAAVIPGAIRGPRDSDRPGAAGRG